MCPTPREQGHWNHLLKVFRADAAIRCDFAIAAVDPVSRNASPKNEVYTPPHEFFGKPVLMEMLFTAQEGIPSTQLSAFQSLLNRQINGRIPFSLERTGTRPTTASLVPQFA